MTNLKRNCYWLFGLLDLYYVVVFLLWHSANFTIPFYQDYQELKETIAVIDTPLMEFWLYLQFGIWVILLLLLPLSSYWYFKQNPNVRWLSAVFVPLRFLSGTFTIPLLWAFLMRHFGISDSDIPYPTIAIFASLLLIEIAKVVLLCKLK